MRVPWALAAASLALVLLPSGVEAHSPDQQPFVRMNGKDAAVYPVGSTSLSDFLLPQDSAPESYMKGTAIHLELLTANLPVAPDSIPETTWQWDFGDGVTASGLAVQHSYTKIGSFVIKVSAYDPKQDSAPQLLDLVYANSLPRADYRLPSASITVNGQHAKDPYADILKINFAQPVTVDGSASEAGSTPIRSYFWDFGDQQTAGTAKATRSYNQGYSSISGLLRVEDENGFFNDQLVQLLNQNIDLNPHDAGAKERQRNAAWLYGLAFLIGAGVILLWARKRKQ